MRFSASRNPHVDIRRRLFSYQAVAYDLARGMLQDPWGRPSGDQLEVESLERLPLDFL